MIVLNLHQAVLFEFRDIILNLYFYGFLEISEMFDALFNMFNFLPDSFPADPALAFGEGQLLELGHVGIVEYCVELTVFPLWMMIDKQMMAAYS